MDTLHLVLALVAGLLAIAAVIFFRKLNQVQDEAGGARDEMKKAKAEKDRARRDSREHERKQEKLENEVRSLKGDLKGVKKDLHKTKEQNKALASKTRRDPTGDREALRKAVADLENAKEESESLRKALAEAEARRHPRDEQADARPSAPPKKEAPAPAPPGPDPRSVRQIEKLEANAERLKKDLHAMRDHQRSRDRDLRNARKSAVSNDRAFRVTQGQLQILREKLTAQEDQIVGMRAAAQQQQQAKSDAASQEAES